jgi:hypothetical protein
MVSIYYIITAIPESLNSTCRYQAKLQQNLMYLAAIADSQPQAQTAHAQVPFVNWKLV